MKKALAVREAVHTLVIEPPAGHEPATYRPPQPYRAPPRWGEPRGYRREETAKFIAFRSHWGFQSQFCTPGEGTKKAG